MDLKAISSPHKMYVFFRKENTKRMCVCENEWARWRRTSNAHLLISMFTLNTIFDKWKRIQTFLFHLRERMPRAQPTVITDYTLRVIILFIFGLLDWACVRRRTELLLWGTFTNFRFSVVFATIYQNVNSRNPQNGCCVGAGNEQRDKLIWANVVDSISKTRFFSR